MSTIQVSLESAKISPSIRSDNEGRNYIRNQTVSTALPKREPVQEERPRITPTPEATEQVASGLSEPPQSIPSPSAADQAAFLHPQETNMAQAYRLNSIELDDQRQQTIPQPEPEQPAETVAPKPSATTARPAADNLTPELNSKGKDKTATPEPEPSADPAQPKQPNKSITDLQYKAPPEQLVGRYIVANGQYLSAENGTTVLFEDKGKKLSTARTDVQTVQDMLEVAKAKGWDSIKLSGTKEFKAMMYVAAESQGIRTRGYAPTPADLALVEKLRTDRSLNSIEPARPQQEHQQNPDIDRPTAAAATVAPAAQPGERIVAHGEAPYRNDAKNQSSYYLTLEKNGRERTIWGAGLPEALTQSGAQIGDRIDLKNLGKQPVTIQTPVSDQEGKVVEHEEKETNRNVFRIEVLERAVEPEATKQPEPSAEQSVPEQPQPKPSENNNQEPSQSLIKEPDRELLAAADRVETAGLRANDAPVDTSSGADTEIPGVTTDRERIPAGAQHIAGKMRGAAYQNTTLDMSLQTTRDNYHTKARRLSKTAKAKLVFYERNTLDAIRGLEGDFRKEALCNFYDQTAQEMHGSKLDQPHPIQVPDPGQNHTAQPNAAHHPAQATEPSRGDDQEIDR